MIIHNQRQVEYPIILRLLQCTTQTALLLQLHRQHKHAYYALLSDSSL